MRPLPLITLFTYLATFDDSIHPSKPLDIRETQNYLMHRALNAAFIQRACDQTSEKADICTWRLTECTDGLLTSLWAYGRHSSFGNGSLSASIEWLPPTLQFIHFDFVGVPGIWEKMCLPRDLKYLYLQNCYCIWMNSIAKCIDFSRLPWKMEELIVMHSTISGTIRFERLPPKMYLVYIEQSVRLIDSIIVNYAHLPQTLEILSITDVHGNRSWNVKEIGVPGRVRLYTKLDRRYSTEASRYLMDVKAKIQDML